MATARLSERVEGALLRGAKYLLERQDATGSWTDWALPPGPSQEWTTAYVGYRLSGVRAPVRDGVAAALARAAGWLLDRRFPAGGWGYNASVDPDADSTALAILFLTAAGRAVPPEAYRYLSRFQRADGGFSTFLPDGLTGSWGRSHPEITPVAMLALLTEPAGPADTVIQSAIDWMRRARRSDGTWNAFWWTTGLGATEASFDALTAIRRAEAVPEVLRGIEPPDALQAALLLSAITGDGWSPCVEALVRRLVAVQRLDGAWHGEPALRITPRDCDRPWDHPGVGPLFGDTQRLFTTATVVAALAKVRNLCLRDRPPGPRRPAVTIRMLLRL